MKHISFLFILAAFAASVQAQGLNFLSSKVQTILETQDRRMLNHAPLRDLTRDTSATIRKAVMIAYANLQDTTDIPFLLDVLIREQSEDVQDALAFAIGETAPQLSESARANLQHELLWVRFDQIQSNGGKSRMIEEIGKFGTKDGLADIVNKFTVASSSPFEPALIMCIARFAIRGITNSQATQYVLSIAKRGDDTPWQAVYALQRIGNDDLIHSEEGNLYRLSQHPDPLVRMNYALILGKLKDTQPALAPLDRLAEFDGDWRVRVNALRAIGTLNAGNDEATVAMLSRLFFDANPYVATSALAAASALELVLSQAPSASKALERIKDITSNNDNGYIWQLQAAGAAALAALEHRKAFPEIPIREDMNPQLKSRMLGALGSTRSKDAVPMLLKYAEGEDALLARTSLEGLQDLASHNQKDSATIEAIYEASIKLLQSDDVAIVTTVASILGDSVFHRDAAIAPLVATLSRLRIPYDVEAIQEICSTLGKMHATSAVSALEKQLDAPDRSVQLAAVAALVSITGRQYSAHQSVEPLYTNFDYPYLASLKDTVKVTISTIRGDIHVDLYRSVAPFTVMSFLKLAMRQGFYRGTSIHRVVPNFVIQGGDPRGDGWGGPGYEIRSEFSLLGYDTGVLGIASAGRDTEGSQFFITQSPQPHLDGRYTIFGKVTSGMDVVNKLQLDDHVEDVQVQN
jgi:peptidylprolyl isomerase